VRLLSRRLVVAIALLGAVAGSVAAEPVAATAAGARQPGRWLQIESAGFRIIFEEGDAAWAAEVARIAPSVRERTTGYLDYDPDEQIPVVLYGRTARANGFFTPFHPTSRSSSAPRPDRGWEPRRRAGSKASSSTS
jgi:hypothetical protein